MSDLPYMPFYVSDYIGDTAHLTTLEHGAYMLLLMNYWMRQKPLPDDPIKLSRIAKVSAKEWDEISDTMAEFFHMADGVWMHKRVDAELAKAKDKLEKAKSAGKASAEARRNVRSTSGEQTINHKVRLGKGTTLETNSSERDARAMAEKFWEKWPHRVNRIVAEGALVSSGVPIEVILAGVERYIASRLPDQQWPDPAKWLENRRWEDEYAPRSPICPAQGLPKIATLDAKRSTSGKVYVLRDTPAGDAWENAAKRRGRTQCWDRDGGWLFAAEFPPTEGDVA